VDGTSRDSPSPPTSSLTTTSPPPPPGGQPPPTHRRCSSPAVHELQHGHAMGAAAPGGPVTNTRPHSATDVDLLTPGRQNGATAHHITAGHHVTSPDTIKSKLLSRG